MTLYSSQGVQSMKSIIDDNQYQSISINQLKRGFVSPFFSIGHFICVFVWLTNPYHPRRLQEHMSRIF